MPVLAKTLICVFCPGSKPHAADGQIWTDSPIISSQLERDQLVPSLPAKLFCSFPLVTVAVNDLCPEGRSLFPPKLMRRGKKK